VVSLDAFREQMRYLATNREVLSLPDLVQRIRSGQSGSNPPPVAVTFDDAYSCVVDFALPILTEYVIPATMFALAEGWGEEMGWESSLSERYRALWSVEQAQMWIRAGLQVGSHGVRHVDMTQLPQEDLEWELTESRRLLGARLHVDAIQGLCYPWGRNRERERAAAQAAGYLFAVGGGYSTRHRGSDTWRLERIMVDHDDDLTDFQAKLSGAYDWLRFVNRFRTVAR
jgi:peptidoglycan/xylan/chitin deacetylase (PgdA/CDA1 family)